MGPPLRGRPVTATTQQLMDCLRQAATLSAVGTVPVAGLALILGIDRFMSEARALTNLVGNGVATLVVAKWTGELNSAQLTARLDNEDWIEAQEPEVVYDARTEHMHSPSVPEYARSEDSGRS